jgi:hypothetical protein
METAMSTLAVGEMDERDDKSTHNAIGALSSANEAASNKVIDSPWSEECYEKKNGEILRGFEEYHISLRCLILLCDLIFFV